MKFIASLLLLLIPALAMAAEDSGRDLQITDWHVTIKTLQDQGFTFETGTGNGAASANIKIKVTDLCRKDTANRQAVGHWFPTTNVTGIEVDHGGIINNPGADNAVDFRFIEGIAGNNLIYRDAGDAVNAIVEFCVEVGLYDADTLIDYAEVLLTYNVNLVTQVPELTGYTVTQAEDFTDAEDTNLSFDGTLLAYFCDPDSYTILTNDGSDAVTTQGSTLNVCFRVETGQFQVKDIMEFTVKNAEAAEPSQLIITDSAPASTIFSTKKCVDEGNDNNVCLVSFLLFADFYDYEALTLTGVGSILLELGGTAAAPPGRRSLRKQNVQIVDGHRKLQSEVTETVDVQPQPFAVEKNHGAGSSADTAMASLAAFGAIAGAALAL